MKAEIFFDVCCLFFDVSLVVHSFSLWLPLSLGVNRPLLFVIVTFDILYFLNQLVELQDIAEWSQVCMDPFIQSTRVCVLYDRR